MYKKIGNYPQICYLHYFSKFIYERKSGLYFYDYIFIIIFGKAVSILKMIWILFWTISNVSKIYKAHQALHSVLYDYLLFRNPVLCNALFIHNILTLMINTLSINGLKGISEYLWLSSFLLVRENKAVYNLVL
jgi:hypothetical protein